MKKILFFLAMVVGLSYSAQAVDLSTYARAKIVEIDIVNDPNYDPNSPRKFGILWQVSQVVTYADQYNPYSGAVNSWAYTIDFSNFYSYDSSYLPYLNPDYPQFTVIWVKMPSYSPHDYWLQRGPAGDRVPLASCSNGYCKYVDSNSQDVRNYEMVTEIIPPEGGTTDLYNTVHFNRRNY